MRDNFWCFWDEFTTQNFRLRLRFPTLSLREMLSTRPPCAEKHCHFMPSIYFFFVSLYLGCIHRVFTYLEHSLHVVYWTGIVFVIFGV
jgi:hypothetical protein